MADAPEVTAREREEAQRIINLWWDGYDGKHEFALALAHARAEGAQAEAERRNARLDGLLRDELQRRMEDERGTEAERGIARQLLERRPYGERLAIILLDAAAAVQAERERCAKVACRYCAAGHAADVVQNDGAWHLGAYTGHTMSFCGAAAIRAGG